MTDERLAEIEAEADCAPSLWPPPDCQSCKYGGHCIHAPKTCRSEPLTMGKVQGKMAKDIHALIAEVRRLREKNAELKNRLAYHEENCL